MSDAHDDTPWGPEDDARVRGALMSLMDDVRDEPRVSLDIDEAVKISFPRRDIDDDEAESISQGRWLEPIGRKEIYVVVDPREQAIALIQEKGRRASSVMVVRPATLR